MANWRDIKRKALGDIHRTFQLPAVYLTHAAGTPVRVNVRLHQKHLVTNPTLGEYGDEVSMLSMSDRIIFHESEVAEVLQDAYVIFSSTEIYVTGPTRPKREGYIWTEVSDATDKDIADLLAQIDMSDPAYEGILS